MNNRLVLAIDKAFTTEQLGRMKSAAERCGAEFMTFDTPQEAGDKLAEAEVIFTTGGSMGTEAARGAKKLKWFASHSAGVDALLAPGILQEGVLLTSGSGSYGLSISEHLIMVTLMLLRRYPDYDNIVRAQSFMNDLPIRSLYGSRVTVCGTGDIGSNYAKRLRAFSPASIIGVSRSGRPVEGFDTVFPVSELDRLLPDTDILAMMLPGTADTAGLISKERMALLPDSAYIINVGRGSAIDQDALIEALQTDRLAGAALDVFAEEPIPPGDPVWNAKNILITPHCSGKLNLSYTVDSLVDNFCENLERYFAGLPLHHLVDRIKGY